MLEQSLLRDQFQALLTREKQVLDAYADLAARSEDPALKEQLLALQRDKQRHIQLAQRLLEIVD